MLKNHSFTTYGKCSEKLNFLPLEANGQMSKATFALIYILIFYILLVKEVI